MAAEQEDEARGDRQPLRILVVEDDYLACLDLEASMIEAGLEVVGTASSADEAVELAARLNPTITIMDVRLRGERTGIDAAIEIYRRFAIRSIIASAYDDPSLVRQAQAANPLCWVHKPYQTTALIELVLGFKRDIADRARGE